VSPRAAKAAVAVALVFACVAASPRAQHVDLSPAFAEVGSDITATVWQGPQQPLAGVVVVVLPPQGDAVEVGPTDAAGRARFRPVVPGIHEFRVSPDGRDEVWITPYQVRPHRLRWLYALVCLPLGLALLWANVRLIRRRAETT